MAYRQFNHLFQFYYMLHVAEPSKERRSNHAGLGCVLMVNSKLDWTAVKQQISSGREAKATQKRGNDMEKVKIKGSIYPCK